ncbi:MAG: hypothetical protein AB1631_08910, partial [Acidobacteriota bacterium]
MKTFLCLICIAVAAPAVRFDNVIACPGASSSDQADLKGSPNPDPQNITVASGAQTIRVRPRNDSEDFRNLQWAFDNTIAGGTVALASGTFFLGDGAASPRRTVWMRRGVRVTGKKEGNV